MSRSDPAAPGRRVLRLWRRLSPLPGGSWLFSRLLGRIVPYSGTTGAAVRELAPGRCRLTLRDRRRVRNHLGSVHAVALVNLGELATGLATLTALPAGVRGIVVGLEAEYEKKARGRLTTKCRTDPPEEVTGTTEHRPRAEIRDGEGDRVAVVRTVWRLDPPEGE